MKFWGKDNSEKGKAWRKKQELKNKERIKRNREAGALIGHLYEVNLECPECGAKLFRRTTTTAILSQMFYCKKCGYKGPVGLEPENKKGSTKKLPSTKK